MKEKDLIELYRRQMAEKTASAPEGLWNDIAKKLVVEEAWDHIAAELDKDTQKKGFWFFGRRAAAVAALISLGMLSIWMLNRDVSTPRLAEQTEISAPPPSAAIPTEPAEQTEISASPPSAAESTESAEQTEIPASPPSAAIPTESAEQTEISAPPPSVAESTESAAEQQPLAGEPRRQSPVLAELPIYDDSHLILQSARERPIHIDLDDMSLSDGFVSDAFSNTNNPSGSFSLGITTAIKNTWLINNETYEGLDRLNHNRTDLKFYPDIGINLHYQHTHRWGIETGLFFSSSTGQSYRQYIHGKYSHRTISLNYLQWELMAIHTTGNRTFRNPNAVSLKSVLGFYASAMNSATEIIEKDQFDVQSLYSGFDYGVVLGQYLQWNPARRFVFSPGIHVKWGLTDIYRGGTHLPVNFSNTYNRSIELRLNMYYSLGR